MVIFESLPTERQGELILMTFYHHGEKDEKNTSLAAERHWLPGRKAVKMGFLWKDV